MPSDCFNRIYFACDLLLGVISNDWNALSKKVLFISLTACQTKSQWEFQETSIVIILSNNLQNISSTNESSLGGTSLELAAWQVKTAAQSARRMAGHSRRFSMTSPVLCSYSSSTSTPFTSHRTDGSGRPPQHIQYTYTFNNNNIGQSRQGKSH